MKTIAIFFLLFCTLSLADAQPFQRSFPALMPMDSAIHPEHLFGKFNDPITASNALMVKDGHFFTKDGKRVRLIGTSLHNAACFPDSAMAVAIARRLAGLGFNAVRLVGIDNQWWRNYGSVFAEANDTKNFDVQQMKKLDRLIVELQKNGVYVVLQLYSQWMPRADDNIPGYDSIPWNGRYANFFMASVIDRTRSYAVKLFNHRNSITNIAYKDDPTIACVELTDDNSLFAAWSNGLLHPSSNFSFTHSALLDAVWNNYLFNKYKTSAALSKAWEIIPNSSALMPNNGNFEDNSDPLFGWELGVNTDNNAVANVYPSNGIKHQGAFSAWIKVNKEGSNVYDVIYVNRSVAVQRFLQYELRFWARTDAAAKYTSPFYVALQRGSGSFENYGLLYQNDAPLTENWREYVTRFRANTSDSISAMLAFYLGAGVGNIYLDDIRITPVTEAGLLASESLEKRNIQRVRRIDESIAVSPVRSADQALFYSALVDNYMTLMQKLLRDTIGTKALITSGTTPTYINEAYSERNLDYSGAVQSTDYVRYVNDRPAGIAQSGIAQDRFLGSLSYMTRNARVGKPHIIGNYLMPNISGRTGEMLTILPFFATYQDWDGLFVANWGDDMQKMRANRLDSNNVWTLPHNSALWALAPSIRHAMDNNVIQSAPRSINLKNTADNFVYPAEQLQYGYWLKQFPDTRMALFRRVRYDSLLASEASEAPHAQIQQLADGTLNTANIISETEELTWNIDIGTVTVNTPRFIAASGVLSGQLFSFGTTRFERTDGGNYGSMTWLSTDTSSLDRSERSVLTLSSRSGNSGMVWRGDTSVWGVSWGTSPVVAEAMTARLSFISDADSIYAVPLDMQGNPMAMTIPATRLSGNRRSFTFDQSQTPALWFSVHQLWKTSSIIEHDDNAPSMTISPNPVTDHATLTLAFPALQTMANVSLISLTGEIIPLWNGIADGSTVWIDIASSSVPAGSYTIKAQAGTWHKTMNIIVY